VAKKKTNRTGKAEAHEPDPGATRAPLQPAEPATEEAQDPSMPPNPEPDADTRASAETGAPDDADRGNPPEEGAAPPVAGAQKAAPEPAAEARSEDMPDASSPETDNAAAAGTAGDMAGQDAPDEAAPQMAEAATEPAEEPAEPAEARPAPVVRTEQVTVRKGGFWSMLLGGIVAAGIGVLAAPHLQPLLPPGWGLSEETGVDAAAFEAQAARIAALEAQLSDLDIPADQSAAVEGLSQTVTDLTGRIAALEAQVADLAARPASGPAPDGATGETVAALEERLAEQTAEDAAQQSAIDALRAEIAALKDEAAAEEAAARDSAQAVLRRAALTRIRTALDTGESFAAALSELRGTGAEVPEALAALAETGVPTRAALAESFPEAARAALAAARAEAGEGASVSAFLRSQLGMRSLTPRAGDDPDAVLSRAEAALAEGRLSDALAEIEALPETARAAMADWAAQARSRADALVAAEALSAAMN